MAEGYKTYDGMPVECEDIAALFNISKQRNAYKLQRNS